MRVLFAGGGTAGHINPALAIAGYIGEKHKNTEVLFVGTEEGLETSIIPESGYKLELIKIHGFQRKIGLETAKTLMELPSAVRASKKIIKSFKPDIVIGTGGYVCGPVLYAAAKLKIPTFVHESNAFPGVTIKILAKYVDKVAVGIKKAMELLPNSNNVIFTGSPIRPGILELTKSEARKKLYIDDRPYIVIFGGSLGARDFNASMIDWICKIKDLHKYKVIMATGKNNQYETAIKRLKNNGFIAENYPEITISEYIYDMDVHMNAADIVVSRAGASTLAELTAIGKPSILVPSPYVTDNHQEFNARAVEAVGGAKVILENELNAEIIDAEISRIVDNKEVLEKMEKSAETMGVKNSTDIIYNEIMALL